MKNTIFAELKKLKKFHKVVASEIGISYARYNDWRWNPDSVPLYGQKLLELYLADVKRKKRAEYE